MLREVANKNKQPDAAHIKLIYDRLAELKAVPQAEITAYTENTRRLALKSKKDSAYKQVGSGRNKRLVLDKTKFSDAEEHELAELTTRASSYQNLGQSGVAERQRDIQIAEQIQREIRSLLP